MRGFSERVAREAGELISATVGAVRFFRVPLLFLCSPCAFFCSVVRSWLASSCCKNCYEVNVRFLCRYVLLLPRCSPALVVLAAQLRGVGQCTERHARGRPISVPVRFVCMCIYCSPLTHECSHLTRSLVQHGVYCNAQRVLWVLARPTWHWGPRRRVDPERLGQQRPGPQRLFCGVRVVIVGVAAAHVHVGFGPRQL